MADMCHREVPQFIYAIEVLCGIFIALGVVCLVISVLERIYGKNENL